jgi:hypothetical protein
MIDELMAYFEDLEAATNTVNAYINEILKLINKDINSFDKNDCEKIEKRIEEFKNGKVIETLKQILVLTYGKCDSENLKNLALKIRDNIESENYKSKIENYKNRLLSAKKEELKSLIEEICNSEIYNLDESEFPELTELKKLINEKKIKIKKGEGALPVKKKDDYEKDY